MRVMEVFKFRFPAERAEGKYSIDASFLFIDKNELNIFLSTLIKMHYNSRYRDLEFKWKKRRVVLRLA